MLPAISETATGFEVTFCEEPADTPYITFLCDHVERTSWGLLTTLQVMSPLARTGRYPGDIVLLDRVNLMKSRDRWELAKRLSEVLEAPKSGRQQDWQRHLEWVAISVSDAMAKPVPGIDLSSRPLPPKQRFLIPGLLAQGKTNVIYGPGGTGKSILAVRIGVSVQSGIDFMGWQVEEDGPVLYLDWEDDEDTMTMRLDKVCRGLGIKRVPFEYRNMSGRGAYERHHADIRFFLHQNPTALVIFDSTAMAMHGSTAGDGADGALKFANLISSLPTTRLLIDHVASEDVKKEGDKPVAKPYGSIFKVNTARNSWEISALGDMAGTTGVSFRHAKCNVGPYLPPFDVAVGWREDAVYFDRL